MASNPKDQINAPLPDNILKGRNIGKDEAIVYVDKLLRQSMPSSDHKQIRGSLNWQFLLDQHSLVKKSKRKPKKTFLTRKQRKEINLLKLPKENWNYLSLEPVRQLWREYMRENLELINRAPTCREQEWNTFSVIVAKSEMVGAEIKIIKSKVPSLVGISGTVVLETKMTFQIVTPQNKLKTILKDTSVFEFILDKLRFTFLGKHLMTRPTDRSVKKIRNLMQPDL